MKKTLLLLISALFLFAPQLRSQIISQEHYLEASEAYKRGDRENASEGFAKSARSADRGGAVAYHNMGNNYERRGDTANAIKSYEEAVRRNPDQIESIERCVYLHHRNGNWRQAIYYGEMGVKADPLNTRIPPLLLDAYDKQRAGKRFYAYDRDQTLFTQEDAAKYHFDFGITGRSSISYKGDFDLPLDPITYIPFHLSGQWRQSQKYSFLFHVENPDNGALMEETVFLSERVEFLRHYRKSAFGGGFYLNHYYDDTFTSNRKQLHDVKIGILYRNQSDKGDLSFSWYPRFLPSDMAQTKGRSLDANMLAIDYVIAYNTHFDLITGFGWREYVFYDHTKSLSDYEGLCDITGGLRFFYNARSNHSISGTLTSRSYLRDRDNSRPYDSFNGQGLMGINMAKWFKGDPLSGYRSTSYIFAFRFDHFIHSKFGLYETLRIEAVTPGRKTNAISLEIGGRGNF